MDETGHSFRIWLGTSWARRGLIPVLRWMSKRREISSIVAIMRDGLLYARHFRTSILSPCVILAPRFFRRKVGTPLLAIWDRHNAHRSQVTTAHPQDDAVADLPAFAPELEPGGVVQFLRQACDGRRVARVSGRSTSARPPQILSSAILIRDDPQLLSARRSLRCRHSVKINRTGTEPLPFWLAYRPTTVSANSLKNPLREVVEASYEIGKEFIRAPVTGSHSLE